MYSGQEGPYVKYVFRSIRACVSVCVCVFVQETPSVSLRDMVECNVYGFTEVGRELDRTHVRRA